MFLTIHDSLIKSIVSVAAQGIPSGPLMGSILDGGDVYQVQGIEPGSGQQIIGRWMLDSDVNLESRDDDLLTIIVNLDQQIRPIIFTSQGVVEVPFDVVRLHANYSARIRGLFEVDTLVERCVTVIGLGTGGGTVAVELVKAGIGRIRLVDFDRLEVHNIARHVCGLSDIGRYKTRALRDLLLDTSPLISVETWEANILDSPDVLAQAIAGADVVIAATDSERSKSAINVACWEASIPAVYGAAYNRAFGGDVIQVIPQETACYECFLSVATELFSLEKPTSLPTDLPYEDPQRLADVIAEPGLGLDVGFVALIQAKMALLTLLRNTQSTIDSLPSNWVLWGNRAEWLFQKPLESIFIDVPRRPDCFFCNREAHIKKTLGMTQDEAAMAAKALLETLPERDSLILP